MGGDGLVARGVYGVGDASEWKDHGRRMVMVCRMREVVNAMVK